MYFHYFSIENVSRLLGYRSQNTTKIRQEKCCLPIRRAGASKILLIMSGHKWPGLMVHNFRCASPDRKEKQLTHLTRNGTMRGIARHRASYRPPVSRHFAEFCRRSHQEWAESQLTNPAVFKHCHRCIPKVVELLGNTKVCGYVFLVTCALLPELRG